MSKAQSDRPKRRPSMSDVGRAADVSAQTVSRYFTGGYVSQEARAKIETAVRELGYSRSRLPRILRAERTDTLGFLAMGPMNYGNADILTGISRAAIEAGQTLLTTQIDLDPSEADGHAKIAVALHNLLSMRVDGIVVGTPYLGVDDLLKEIAAMVPVVFLSEVSAPGVTAVHADSYGAALHAARHLTGLGHRRILHLAGPANRNESTERLRGYHDALAEAHVAPLPVVQCREWDATAGAEAATKVHPSSFSAVLAASDQIALGFMAELREQGLTAPADYSIVGIDDMPDAKYYAPPLTSSRLDFVRVGEIAMEAILERIGGRPLSPAVVVPSVLSVRSSTAPFR
ncbi:LacI family DNA-binding transcriptional regulator [Streptomyces shenzhenensis]|uniref:LacI family DNA-binding transcriptional regulator n=1 Tax=Streptomyces shenzhenensis TaxID=943815 RepID=UPI0033FEFED5